MNDDLTFNQCAATHADLRSTLEGSLSYYDGITKIYNPYDPFKFNEPGINAAEAYPLTFEDAITVEPSDRLDEVINRAVREAIEERDVTVRPGILKYKLKHR